MFIYRGRILAAIHWWNDPPSAWRDQRIADPLPSPITRGFEPEYRSTEPIANTLTYLICLSIRPLPLDTTCML